MIKHYVLDTNVLLYDPNSINVFDDNYIHIPMVVLEELDTFKKDRNELGVNARKVINFLDSLRTKGKLCEGVSLDSGGKLFVSSSYKKIDSSFSKEHPDNKLLQLSYYLKSLNHGTQVVLITKDINLRVKADAIGIESQDYKRPSEGNGSLYEGVKEIKIDGNIIDKVYSDGECKIDEDFSFTENEYIIMKDINDENHSGLGVFKNNKICSLKTKKNKAVNILSKNVRQTFALDALLDKNISVVTITGISGTGKTLISVASAIQQSIVDGDYAKITITRPTVSVGKELGFLPGEIEDKLDPWIKPIYDSIDLIRELDIKSGRTKLPVNSNIESFIEMAPLCYIRGRSLINSFMIIDESQNLSPLEIKTIATRVGQNTKIVFTGDINQIDNPYLNKHSNGLSQLIKRFKGQKFFAHISLTEGERSEVAEAAAKLL